ncbi:MAG TPA: hypothetical protein VH062_15475 [Polyangiaceae bacterium]|jgi:hypothetical protein|nr:hypothetical protein [Polyangiaceae bacterium]
MRRLLATLSVAALGAVPVASCGSGTSGDAPVTRCPSKLDYESCVVDDAAGTFDCSTATPASCPDTGADRDFAALTGYLKKAGFAPDSTSLEDVHIDGAEPWRELVVSMKSSDGSGRTAQLGYDVKSDGSHTSQAAILDDDGSVLYGLGVSKDGAVGKYHADSRTLPSLQALGAAVDGGRAERPSADAGATDAPTADAGIGTSSAALTFDVCGVLCSQAIKRATCYPAMKAVCAATSIDFFPCLLLRALVCSLEDTSGLCRQICGPTCPEDQRRCFKMTCCTLCEDCVGDGVCQRNDSLLCDGRCCPAGQTCVKDGATPDGACRDCPLGEVTCPSGPGLCFTEDENNCGACGVKCAAGEKCCDSRCVDTSTDDDDCGGCGSAATTQSAEFRCTGGEACIDGKCVDCGDGSCASPFATGACVLKLAEADVDGPAGLLGWCYDDLTRDECTPSEGGFVPTWVDATCDSQGLVIGTCSGEPLAYTQAYYSDYVDYLSHVSASTPSEQVADLEAHCTSSGGMWR